MLKITSSLLSKFTPRSCLNLNPLLANSVAISQIGNNIGQRTYANATEPSTECGARKMWVNGGIHLSFREEGEGDHVLLCLPGLLGTHEKEYGALFDTIDLKKFRVICWDPPGFGNSRPIRRFSIGDFYKRDAHLVSLLMEKLGYKDYSIIGGSIGGQTAINLAVERKTLIKKMVIWGAHAFYDDKILQELYDWCDIKNWSMYNEEYDEEYMQKMLTEYKDSVEHYVNTEKDERLKELMPQVECPTLILHGEKNQVCRKDQAVYYKDHIKNAKLHLMPDAGLDLHITHSKEFVPLVEKFLLE